MIAQYLIILGGAILSLLGGVHLYYTFFSNKFSSREPEAAFLLTIF